MILKLKAHTILLFKGALLSALAFRVVFVFCNNLRVVLSLVYWSQVYNSIKEKKIPIQKRDNRADPQTQRDAIKQNAKSMWAFLSFIE